MIIAYVRSSEIYNESRATKEIVALINAGHTVHVIAWDRSGAAEEGMRKLDFGSRSTISYDFFKNNSGKNKLYKMLVRLKWSKWIYSKLKSLTNVDAVHACDYDTGEAAMRFCMRNRVKFVYDIFDYYVDAHKVPRMLKKWIEKREIKVINSSDVTILCTEERRAQIVLASPKKIVVIHNSPDIEETPEYKNNIYDYVYCGSLNNGRLIKEIFMDYYKHSNFTFAVAGKGLNSVLATELDRKYKSFSYFDSITYTEVLNLEKRSKVISAIYDPSIRNHQLCAPNKFYEALALGKPLIVCKGTGIDKIVERENLGMVIEYNTKSFYSALDYLITNEEEAIEMGNRGREIYMEKYQWKFMEEKLLQLYADLIH